MKQPSRNRAQKQRRQRYRASDGFTKQKPYKKLSRKCKANNCLANGSNPADSKEGDSDQSDQYDELTSIDDLDYNTESNPSDVEDELEESDYNDEYHVDEDTDDEGDYSSTDDSPTQGVRDIHNEAEGHHTDRSSDTLSRHEYTRHSDLFLVHRTKS